jgi:hypothetical protein
MKQHCRDVYVINYRLRGLAGKKFKTQKIVIANIEKFRVRSEKFYGGTGLRRCNRSWGFSANFTKHKKEQENYIFLRRLVCKILSSSMAPHGSFLLAEVVAI